MIQFDSYFSDGWFSSTTTECWHLGCFFPKAVMLQIMASFVMAIMTACALMWASGAMEPWGGWKGWVWERMYG